VPLSSTGTLAISDVSINKIQVARYEKVEITFQMKGRWQNPCPTARLVNEPVDERRRRVRFGVWVVSRLYGATRMGRQHSVDHHTDFL